MAEETQQAVEVKPAKKKPGRPKGSGGKPGRPKGRPGRPKGSGRKAGRPAGRPKAVRGGLISGIVAKQVKAILKGERKAQKAQVQSLVAKEIKKALKQAFR